MIHHELNLTTGVAKLGKYGNIVFSGELDIQTILHGDDEPGLAQSRGFVPETKRSNNR